MGRHTDFRGLEAFAKNFEKLEKNVDQIAEKAIKELAARLLALVIKRTPPLRTQKKTVPVLDENGKKVIYKRGKNKGKVKTKTTTAKHGGTLKRGWTAKTHREAEAGTGNGGDVGSYVNSVSVKQAGKVYTVEVINPVEYASYVEFGHRTRNHKDWVDGQYMLKISSDIVDRAAPQVVQKIIEKFLSEAINGK